MLKAKVKFDKDLDDFDTNEDSQVRCKPLTAIRGEKEAFYSKMWEEYYDVMEIVKLDCFSKQAEYEFWDDKLTTIYEPKLNIVKTLNTDLMRCDKEVSEKHSESIKSAIVKSCKEVDVAGDLTAQNTSLEAFFTTRAAQNEIENTFQAKEEDIKKFNKVCMNKSSFRFKEDQANCAEGCLDGMPNSIAYPDEGKI